jgi:hypothetical protein
LGKRTNTKRRESAWGADIVIAAFLRVASALLKTDLPVRSSARWKKSDQTPVTMAAVERKHIFISPVSVYTQNSP